MKHLGCLLQNSLRKTNDGIDHQKSNDPEQQHGQYKKSKTVFYKINRFKGPLIGIRINPQSKCQRIGRRPHNQKMGIGRCQCHGHADGPGLTGNLGHDPHGNDNGPDQGHGGGIGHKIGHQAGKSGHADPQPVTLIHANL